VREREGEEERGSVGIAQRNRIDPRGSVVRAMFLFCGRDCRDVVPRLSRVYLASSVLHPIRDVNCISDSFIFPLRGNGALGVVVEH